jgi:hypothetical protein
MPIAALHADYLPPIDHQLISRLEPKPFQPPERYSVSALASTDEICVVKSFEPTLTLPEEADSGDSIKSDGVEPDETVIAEEIGFDAPPSANGSLGVQSDSGSSGNSS